LHAGTPRYPRTDMDRNRRLHRRTRQTVAARATCAAVLLGAMAGAALAGDSAPAVGDAAPAFELNDQSGAAVSLASFKGKSHVLLAFYPKDFAPACSNEMKCLDRSQRDLERHGVTILAVSLDGSDSHTRFAKTLGLHFQLLTDGKLAVAKRYGVHAASPTGGFAMRSVFLIDKEGVLRHVDRDFRVSRELTGTALLEAVGELDEAGGDVLATLADLPSPEREGKTLLARTAIAVLAEDVDAVDALLHADFRAMPGETAEATRERRKEFLDLCRKTFAAHDLSGKRLSDVFRLDAALVLDRDAATGTALKTFRSQIRVLASGLAPGDVLVAVRGRGLYGEGGATVLDRELAIVMRKEGESWLIVQLSGR